MKASRGVLWRRRLAAGFPAFSSVQKRRRHEIVQEALVLLADRGCFVRNASCERALLALAGASVLHRERHFADRPDVFERISRHGDDAGGEARLDRAASFLSSLGQSGIDVHAEVLIQLAGDVLAHVAGLRAVAPQDAPRFIVRLFRRAILQSLRKVLRRYSIWRMTYGNIPPWR